jgi:membrane-bound serine protease (ClpP class)
MVDPAVVITALVTDGQLLTLTTQQAQDIGYIDGISTDRAALLQAAGLAGGSTVEPLPNWAETSARFLTNSLVAAILLSVGLLLLMADVFTAGFGALGVGGLALLSLFFWGHSVVGLAGWEGVALVVVGLALIALEVLIIPGFGVAGIAGALALLGGIFISLFDARIVTTPDLVRAGSTVLGAGLLVAGGAVVLAYRLPRSTRMQGLILQSKVGLPDAVPLPHIPSKRRSWLEGDRLEAQRPGLEREQAPAELRSFTGAIGVARSDLRPAGIAEIGGARVDVVSRGEYITAGSVIEVLVDEGYRRVVRHIEHPE